METEGILQRFGEHQLALNHRQCTVEWYATMLKRFFAFIESQGVSSLNDVNDKNLINYQHYVFTLKNEKGESYSVPSQNLHLTAIRKLYKYLRMIGEVDKDPTSLIEFARRPKQLPRDMISVEEMRKLLSQPDITKADGIRDQAIMEILYSTGIRRAELLGLNINDIYFDARTMRVMGKGQKERIVPFGRIACKWLQKYLAEVRPVIAKEKSGEAVFLSMVTGECLGKQGLKYIIEKYGKKAGFRRQITPHTFRHSTATHLLENGADVRLIQELLGHENLSTTATYLHISIGRLKDVHSRCHPREVAVA